MTLVDPGRPLRTRRLELIPARAEHLRAEVEGRDALQQALAVDIPAAWPPDLYDPDAVQFFLARFDDIDTSAAWGSYYIVRRLPSVGRRVAIGVGGFKGAPDQGGTVEIGYSLLAEFQHQGFAVEAVRGWLTFAHTQPSVVRIVAHTLANRQPSIRVLDRTGFACTGRGNDPGAPPGEIVLRYEFRLPRPSR